MNDQRTQMNGKPVFTVFARMSASVVSILPIRTRGSVFLHKSTVSRSPILYFVQSVTFTSATVVNSTSIFASLPDGLSELQDGTPLGQCEPCVQSDLYAGQG